MLSVEAEPDVLQCLLAGLGDMHQANETPRCSVDLGPELRRPFLDHAPMQCQGIEPGGLGGPDRQQPDPVRAGQLRPGRRSHGGDRDIEEGAGVRAEMQPRISEIPPVVLEGDRLIATQQAHDDFGSAVNPGRGRA